MEKEENKTFYLDREINLLNCLKRNNELSEYGEQKLKEFINIKAENEELKKRVEVYKYNLHRMVSQLSMVDCFQGCNNGVIQESEEDIYQCQWCGEQEEAKKLLTNK